MSKNTQGILMEGETYQFQQFNKFEKQSGKIGQRQVYKQNLYIIYMLQCKKIIDKQRRIQNLQSNQQNKNRKRKSKEKFHQYWRQILRINYTLILNIETQVIIQGKKKDQLLFSQYKNKVY
ncbi:unnamed protein product [Paramecium sonneborni]|uniref:Uncharacterized protein n=1 Tax=Paramecium sonneborni TaxID=65129 RepID=A0A8S1N5K6_9CILI|nr:unnamed protein product [Paramecium sonneborni]